MTVSAPIALALLACYLVWGSTYLAIRLALVSFPPFFQMGTRFLVAGALLMGWVFWSRRQDASAAHALPTRRQWAHALLVGTLMLGAGMGLTATASVEIGSGLIAACIAVVPMMISGWGLLWRRRPSRGEFAGMLAGDAVKLLPRTSSSTPTRPSSM
ncbi:MAG: permease, partial [Comamonadaceae bacterium]